MRYFRLDNINKEDDRSNVAVSEVGREGGSSAGTAMKTNVYCWLALTTPSRSVSSSINPKRPFK